MNEEIQATSNGRDKLGESARELSAATAESVVESMARARKHLAAVLERWTEICGQVRVKALAGAREANTSINENPGKAIAISIGIGVLIGYLVASRGDSNRE